MKGNLAQEAGTALFWKVTQQGGVNLLYLCRLLILARLLSPDDFGLVAIAMTAIGLFLKLTDFGMQPALVQKPQATDQHYDSAWTVGLFRAVAVGGVVFLTAPLIGDVFGEPRTVGIIRVLALLPVVEALASIKVVELVRRLQFRSMATARLCEAFTNTAVCIALAPVLGVWALVAGALAGPSAFAILSYVLAPYRPRVALDRSAARSLIHYGRWIFVTGLVAMSAAALLRALISRQLGTAELGLYFLAAKLAFWPNEVATEVVGAVAFPVYARVQANRRQATRAFRAVLTSIVLALTPVFALMIALAPSGVVHVLGPQWTDTGSLIQLLAIVGLVGLVGDAVVPLLKGLGQPYLYALLESGQSLLLVACAAVLIQQFGLPGVGYAWVVAIAATVTAGILFARRILENPFAGVASSWGAIGAASALGALAAHQIQGEIEGILGLGLAVASGVALIAAALWTVNRLFELKLTGEVARVFPQAAPLLAKCE